MKIIEYIVARRDCPEGDDWHPIIHYRLAKDCKLIDMVSVWPDPLIEGGDGATMPGTWVADLGGSIIVRAGQSVKASKEIIGEVVKISLERIVP